MKYQLNQVRKFLAAGLGAAAVTASELLALGDVIPDDVARWATVIVALATALGVFGVPNEPTAEQAEKVKAEQASPALTSDDQDAIVADPAIIDRILKGN